MRQEMDETTQQEAMVVIEHKEDLHPQIVIIDDAGEPIANYPIPSGAHIVLSEDDKIVAGTLMAKSMLKSPCCKASLTSSSASVVMGASPSRVC